MKDEIETVDSSLTSLNPDAMRLGFIRKVYGILSMQLVLTSLVGYVFMYQESVNSFVLANTGLIMWPCFFLTLGLLCGLHFHKTNYPVNYYLLTAFTLAEAAIIGIVCASYEAAGYGFLVLQAVGITAGIFLSLTAFTVVSKTDFGFMRMYLFSALMGMIFWGFFCALFGFQTSYLYSLFGVLLFCGFIVYDTWKITKKYGYDEYIPAAIDLYLDIINLFLYVLDLLGKSQK